MEQFEWEQITNLSDFDISETKAQEIKEFLNKNALNAKTHDILASEASQHFGQQISETHPIYLWAINAWDYYHPF